MSYRVKTKIYSGPFDLLLQLVSRQKLDIGTLSLTEVVDQYLLEVEHMIEIDLDVASDFLLVATTLLDLKAQSLLPSSNSDDNDGDLDWFDVNDIETSREMLVERLIAYKKFRSASSALEDLYIQNSKLHPSQVSVDTTHLHIIPDYLKGITLHSLALVCADLNSRQETLLLEAEHIAPKKIPLALTIASVNRLTLNKKECTFTSLLSAHADTEEIVVSFLALLELYKQGVLTLEQVDNFEDIRITRIQSDTELVFDEGDLEYGE